ncbi:MAG: acetyl-CoA C-acetyltransferase [Spirochaetaceae bacterium]|jgi:acetyl-CoA C-acetyltransferase|nr:acetyl-CoA C-acetyltransferase [Spirochaetaceae bacterium]
MKKVYIIDAARTAVGTFGGSLAHLSAVDLGTTVVQELINRNNLDSKSIDELIMGCVLQSGLGQNVARQIAINAGIAREKTSMTINMVCGSGLKSVSLAAQAIKAGDADLIIAGGTESMSNSPYLSMETRFGGRMGNLSLVDSMVKDGLWDAFNNFHMGITAENVAEKYNISREDQDIFAVNSQNKAVEAQSTGKFEKEIVSVFIPRRKNDPIEFRTDEYIRVNTRLEKLRTMKPAFKEDGSVTAANSSGINDGASAIIVASEEAVEKYKLSPMAEIISYGAVGNDPAYMGAAPIEAVKTVLDKACWTMDEIDLIEANEAFASQSLAVIRETGMNKDKVNVNGGAIAIGHPIGASGARILTTLIYAMKDRNKEKGLAVLCIGGGMGIAMCIKMIK